MELCFISKSEENSLSEEEVLKVFNSTDDLDKIKQVVEKARDRIYTSWASVEMKDKSGELIKIEDLMKEQDILLERGGPISDEHTNKIVGKTMAYKVLEHPKTKTLGIFHLNKIFNHNAKDDIVWKETQSGERKGSSVGGYHEALSIDKDKVTGQYAKVLDKFHQYETANVHDPCCPLALNHAVSAVAKSADKQANVINKFGDMYNQGKILIKNKGDNPMENEEFVKKFEDIHKSVTSFGDKIEDISKRVEALETNKAEDAEEKKPEEEEKKQEEPEKKPEKEEEKKKADAPVKEESASSKIEGEGDAKQPESPEPKASNDEDVVKKVTESVISAVEKKLEDIKKSDVKKHEASRAKSDVKKSNPLPDAEKIALGQYDVKKAQMELDNIEEAQKQFLSNPQQVAGY